MARMARSMSSILGTDGVWWSGSAAPDRAVPTHHSIQSDSCQPARATGTFSDEAVFAAPDGVGFWVPLDPPSSGGSGGFRRIDATREGGPLDVNLTPCGGTSAYQEHVDVTGYDDHVLDVRVGESWSSLSTCPQGGGVVYAGVPESDCSATRTLHYDLTLACNPPCELVQPAPTSAITCRCS
jgi:hypothetical protein